MSRHQQLSSVNSRNKIQTIKILICINLYQLCCFCLCYRHQNRHQRGVFKKNNVYYIDYYLANGRRKRKRIGASKKAAERVLQKIKTDIIEGKYLDIQKDKKKRFKEYSENYVERYCKHNKATWESDKHSLKQFTDYFGNIYIGEIAVEKVEGFRRQRLESGVKRATVNRAVTSLKTMLNRAVINKDLRKNPILEIKNYTGETQRIRYLEKEELERLLKECPAHTRNVVVFAINTGMRKSEMFNLTWSAVDFENEIMFIHKTKNKERRVVPMTQPVKVLLMNLKEHSKSEYVFANKKGIKLNSVRKSFVNAVKRAEIKDFRFHDLRHTFASYLAMEGVGLHVIGQLLGHKRIDMTMRYSHISDEYKAKAISNLSDRLQSIQSNIILDDKELLYSDIVKEESVEV